jgi:hypothetical protein
MAFRLLLLLPLLVLAGCATEPSMRLRASAGHCDPPLAYRYPPDSAPKPDLDAALTPELLARYPRRNLLTANAVGILPALQALATLPPAGGPAPDLAREVAVLRQRQVILTRLALASSTLSSLAAEVDCEGERADQMARYLSDLDDRRTQRLNALSIVVGALGGAGATISDRRSGQYAFGIGGGLAAAGLGLLTLAQDGHTQDFPHPRNLLADIWTGSPASGAWPPGVWYMLTEPAFSNQGVTSIARNTRQRWQYNGPLARPDSDEGRRFSALLFGAGGTYSAAQLSLRADMLNELQSAVRLLHQELQGLLLTFSEE